MQVQVKLLFTYTGMATKSYATSVCLNIESSLVLYGEGEGVIPISVVY